MGFCSECGAKFDGAKFCPECGHKTAESAMENMGLHHTNPKTKPVHSSQAPEVIPSTGDSGKGLNPTFQGSAGAAVSHSNDAFAAIGIAAKSSAIGDVPCTRCSKPVCMTDTEDGHVDAKGKIYHGACFTCKTCNKALQFETSYLVDGDYVCAQHNREEVTCYGCKNLIDGERYDAVGEAWHPNCFICVKCGLSLSDKPYRSVGKDAYCKMDYREMFPEQAKAEDGVVRMPCAECGEDIESNVHGEYLENNGQTYHRECWDLKHNHSMKTCTVCDKPMTEWVELDGKCMHKACWSCKNCKEQLSAATAKKRKGKYYCVPCFKDPFRAI